MSRLDMEYIERKGIGHPDSVADLISEETMKLYRKYAVDNYGVMPNGWFDKVVITGGEANVAFGEAGVTKKPKIILCGKAMKFDQKIDYIDNIFNQAVDNIIGEIFGKENLQYIDRVTEVNSGVGAEHAKGFYSIAKGERLDKEFSIDAQKANDTVVCAGWWPLSQVEKSVVVLENYINSEDFKNRFPETGYDVKVVAIKNGDSISYTTCIPFIASKTPSIDFYSNEKKSILADVRIKMIKYLGHNNIEIFINTKDSGNNVYLTVFGSAFDKGDVGVTGRGNRYPGIISILRPSGVEAYSGKNTYNHSGKLYTYLSTQIAKKVHEKLDGNIEVIVSTDDGLPINIPKSIVVVRDGLNIDSKSIGDIISECLKDMSTLATNLDESSTIDNFKACYGFLPE